MTDHDKLREAINNMRGLRRFYMPDTQAAVDTVLAAAESTLPKTKMVEVWRVEYAEHIHKVEWRARVRGPFLARCDADNEAVMMAKLFSAEYACIRVTGPHQQEVPA